MLLKQFVRSKVLEIGFGEFEIDVGEAKSRADFFDCGHPAAVAAAGRSFLNWRRGCSGVLR